MLFIQFIISFSVSYTWCYSFSGWTAKFLWVYFLDELTELSAIIIWNKNLINAFSILLSFPWIFHFFWNLTYLLCTYMCVWRLITWEIPNEVVKSWINHFDLNPFEVSQLHTANRISAYIYGLFGCEMFRGRGGLSADKHVNFYKVKNAFMK